MFRRVWLLTPLSRCRKEAQDGSGLLFSCRRGERESKRDSRACLRAYILGSGADIVMATKMNVAVGASGGFRRVGAGRGERGRCEIRRKTEGALRSSMQRGLTQSQRSEA